MLWLGETALPSRGLDIERSGLRLFGPWGPQPGRELTVELSLGATVIFVLAAVVRCEAIASGYLCALRFSAMSPEASEAIRRYVEAGVASTLDRAA